jgi:hypothetical protein
MKNFKENNSNNKSTIKQWLKRIFNVTTIGTSVGIISLAFAVYTYIKPMFDTFPATIKVQGWNATNDIPLRREGTIVLFLGDKRETAKIDDDGEAIFRQVLPKYKNKKVRIKLEDIERPYDLTQDTVCLKKGDLSIVEVRLKGLDRFHGNIYDCDTNTGLQGVRVRIAGIDTTYTNEWGDFSINIPIEKQEITQKIEFSKHGYESYKKDNYNMVEAEDNLYKRCLEQKK